MRNHRLAVAMCGLLAGFGLTAANAADVADQVASDCGACHQLSGTADSLQARAERKAPTLSYAGNKFQEAWLVSWLQSPGRIRPAGDFPLTHAKTGPDGDVIDEAALIQHPSLSEADARTVAAYLMTLTPHSDLIAAEDYTPGKVPERLGAMDFVKFKGCGACHRDTPEYGGVSGPELYTAWNRLQPEFIVSYTRNPTAWEPYSIMPNKHLQTPQIHKIADYLKVIGEKGAAAK